MIGPSDYSRNSFSRVCTKSNPLIAAIIATLLSAAVFVAENTPSFAAAKIGVKYWLTDDHRAPNYETYYLRTRFEMLETKWIEVVGEENVSHYAVRLSNGKLDAVRKDWVDDAITAKVLLTYNPVDKAKADAAAAEKLRAERIKAKKWPNEISAAVLDRKIVLGMTREQVETSWGKPQKINRTVGGWGIREQ